MMMITCEITTQQLSEFHHVVIKPKQLRSSMTEATICRMLKCVPSHCFKVCFNAVKQTNLCLGRSISCTTRPLLGCVWEFPSSEMGSAFASSSLALNEVLPLVLMVCTNLATLHALAKHIRSVTSGVEPGETHMEVDKHVSTERKAAHVIMSLVSLFVVCWVLQVAAVTYYNHDRGHHAEGLLTVAHFSASLFVGFSPMVVALGHGKLRKRIMSMIDHYPDVLLHLSALALQAALPAAAAAERDRSGDLARIQMPCNVSQKVNSDIDFSFFIYHEMLLFLYFWAINNNN